MKQNALTLRARPSLLALTTLSALGVFAATSQAAPLPRPTYNIGDAVRDTQMPEPEPQPLPAPTPAPLPIEQAERPLSLPSGETLLVREFKFEGAERIPEAELQAAVASYRDRALTMADIEAAAARVTALYRERGYPVARAYVPRQNASSGVLVIRVLLGKYGQFNIKNRSLVRGSLVERVFAPLKQDSAVSNAGLERAMLLTGDLPGAQLPRVTVSPGSQPGSSDFAVEVDPDKRVGGYLIGDNLDSKYTGKNRLSAGLTVNSPFGIADRFAVTAASTEDSRLLDGRLAYSVPLTASGLRAELAGSRTSYRLGEDYADLGASGVARTLETTFSYPLLRSRTQNLNLNLNLADRHMHDDVEAAQLSNPKRAKVATLGLQHEAWGSLLGRSGYTALNASVSYGRLDLSDPALTAFNRAGANTIGDYSRLNLGVSTNWQLANRWSLNAAASGQHVLNNKNLDSSEQMSISGRDGVKAYRESVSGDNGYLLNAELRYALPNLLPDLSHSLGLFADTGRVYYQHGDYAASNGALLSDAGVGYYLRYQALFGRLQWAHALGSTPAAAGPQGRERALAQLGLSF
jgi:hemolysin activation/secretion protein